jgi:hypothetical protein
VHKLAGKNHNAVIQRLDHLTRCAIVDRKGIGAVIERQFAASKRLWCLIEVVNIGESAGGGFGTAIVVMDFVVIIIVVGGELRFDFADWKCF